MRFGRGQMNWYIVFASEKRPANFVGGKRLDWGQPPIGVYRAESPEEACQAAAQDHGSVSTMFAVEGTPWGLDMMERPAATQLGNTGNVMDRIAGHLNRIDELEEGRRQLEAARRHELEAGSDAEH